MNDADRAYVEHAKRLFEYDRWANEGALNHLAAAPDAPPHTLPDAAARIAHAIACLELWLSRLEGRGNPQETYFWPDWPVAEAIERNGRAHARWASFLGALDGGGLDRVVRCESISGEGVYDVAVRNVLVQLPLHGAYHRGQASVYIKGAAPPFELDYIFTELRPVA